MRLGNNSRDCTCCCLECRGGASLKCSHIQLECFLGYWGSNKLDTFYLIIVVFLCAICRNVFLELWSKVSVIKTLWDRLYRSPWHSWVHSHSHNQRSASGLWTPFVSTKVFCGHLWTRQRCQAKGQDLRIIAWE